MQIAALLGLVIMITYPATTLGQWEQFRGPGGQGHSQATGLPLRWSETENIIWKVSVPGSGWSSPVIAGGQIWITTAVDKGRSLKAVCFDQRSGELLHDIELFHRDDGGPLHSMNSYATPTPVIEDDRVYVHFGPAGTACLSTGGQVIWKTSRLKYRQPYAGASSPVLFHNMLILSCDGTDVQFIVALDKQSGTVVWKTNRLHLDKAREKIKNQTGWRQRFPLMAYSTPLVIDVDGTAQLISPGADHVAAYNAATGKEIWWCGYDGFSLVARPVYKRGIAFVVGVENHGNPVLYAFRPDARGEIIQSELVWRLDRSVPHVPSPLLIGDELYLINDKGIASCLDASSGRVHWRERIGGNFSASPIYADGKIFLFSEEGKATIVAPGKQFKLLAGNQLEGRFMASPAVTAGALFLRTDSHLYRIEKKGQNNGKANVR